MSQKHAILKLNGKETTGGAFGKIDKDLLIAKGVPADAKEVRRYLDVAYGDQIVAIVFDHKSFKDVQPGGAIPEIQKAVVAVAQKDAPKTSQKQTESDK